MAAGQVATEAAARVGHLRAEMNARAAAMYALFDLGETGACLEQLARTRALVRRLGAWRFEASCLCYLGQAALLDGRRDEAVDLLRQAVELCRRTGITFQGPRTLSALALAVTETAERHALLAEGEAIIRAGCVGHNPPSFYRDAIEVCLDLGEFREATRHAAALEDYTRPEPLPWADFYIARGRALAEFQAGDRRTRACWPRSDTCGTREVASAFGSRWRGSRRQRLARSTEQGEQW